MKIEKDQIYIIYAVYLVAGRIMTEDLLLAALSVPVSSETKAIHPVPGLFSPFAGCIAFCIADMGKSVRKTFLFLPDRGAMHPDPI
ncbi:MAG: hypothetical protein II664_08565 [Oscillospiraceae bacterium]|nr:hypothetical protein [Oscillospiraceae bacterium]